jgi:hypothetical protein
VECEPCVFYGLGGLGGGFNLLYEESMEEWKRGCMLKRRTIHGIHEVTFFLWQKFTTW